MEVVDGAGDDFLDPWGTLRDGLGVVRGRGNEHTGGVLGRGEFTSSRDNLLICLDARSCMLASNGTGRSFLSASLAVVVQVLKAKCDKDASARVGLVLLGVPGVGADGTLGGVPSAARVAGGLQGVCTLLDLAEPSVRDIKALRLFAAGSDGLARLARRVGPSAPPGAPLPLEQGLWECMAIFRKRSRQQERRRIWLVTCDDSPLGAGITSGGGGGGGYSSALSAALMRAKDCADMGLTITLWPLQCAQTTMLFDLARFWEDFLLVDELPREPSGTLSAATQDVRARRRLVPGGEEPESDEEISVNIVAVAGTVSSTVSAAPPQLRAARFGTYIVPTTGEPGDPQLKSAIAKRLFPRRVATRLCLDLAPNISLAVGVYNLVLSKTRPAAGRMHRDSGDPVTAVRETLCAATAAPVDEAGLIRFHELGGQKVFFVDGDIRDLRAVRGCGNGLRLLGFRQRASLSAAHAISHPQFIYPSEREIEGSTAAFRALHARMRARDVVGIASLQMHATGEPRAVALMPQAEVLDASGAQLQPAGFVMARLPFAEDLRALPPAPTWAAVVAAASVVANLGEQLPPPPPDHTVASRAVVRCLTIAEPPFSALRSAIHNPALAKFWALLEQAALGELAPAWLEALDDSAPPREGMVEAAGDDLRALAHACGLTIDGALPSLPKKATGAKRARVVAGGGTGDGASERAAKRACVVIKELIPADDAAFAGVRDELAAGLLAKRTVPKLKDILRAWGMPLGGTKADILQRIEEIVSMHFVADKAHLDGIDDVEADDGRDDD